MKIDIATIALLVGLTINFISILGLVIKIGKLQGAIESRLKGLEDWRNDHESANVRTFDRFDQRICGINRRVYGDEDSETIFLTRREFEQFKDFVQSAHKTLRECVNARAETTNDLIKTYFNRAEDERKKIWDELRRIGK